MAVHKGPSLLDRVGRTQRQGEATALTLDRKVRTVEQAMSEDEIGFHLCVEDVTNTLAQEFGRPTLGNKRNPFNEPECGHHYARAIASWAAVLALTGFHYSAVEKTMTFAPLEGTYFWSNGYAWGTCALDKIQKNRFEIELSVLHGQLSLKQFKLRDLGKNEFGKLITIKAPEQIKFEIPRCIY